MRVYLQTKLRNGIAWYCKATLFTFLLFFFHFNAFSQGCDGTTACQVCNVTAVISNVQGATVVNGGSTIANSVDPGAQGIELLLN